MQKAITSSFQLLMSRYSMVLYALILVLVFWPITFAGYSLQYDAIDVYLPWRFYGSESLREGITPLWNPFQDGGYPFYADHQYSIWNPELFFVSLFTRYNASTIVWLFILYLAIGASGFRFFAKQFKVNEYVAFLGGLIFMLSGTMIGHAQSVISILGAVWLPWALGAYIKALRSNFQWKDTLLAAFMLFMMLVAGYQAVSIMLFYVILSLFLVYFWRNLKGDRSQLRSFFLGHAFIVVVLATLLFGVAISIIEVFPYLERLSGLDLGATAKYSVHPKSLLSFVLPFTTSQSELPGSAVSAQNFFMGVAAFIAILYGVRSINRKDAVLRVLLIFSVIYGVASFGSWTPLQPFLAKYLPGMNLFFYAVFFRYFTLLTLLLIACFGFQRIIDEDKNRSFRLWMIISAAVYIVLVLITSSSSPDWDSILSAPLDQRLFGLPEKTAIYMESLFHALVLIVSVLLLMFFKRRNFILVLIGIVLLELGVMSQLNMPITVHGSAKQAEINDFLDQQSQGFPIPDESRSLIENERDMYPYVLWRNQGNFTNRIIPYGWTSFHLSSRKRAYNKPLSEQQFLYSKPLLFLQNDSVRIDKYTPQEIACTVHLKKRDTLYFQQANYPGWKAYVNGIAKELLTAYDYIMALPLDPGTSEVSFKFHKPLISYLYYLTMLGWLVLGCAVVYFNVPFTYRKLSIALSSGILLFVVFRVYTFKPSDQQKIHIRFDHTTEEYAIPVTLDNRFHHKIINHKAVSIQFDKSGSDPNLESYFTGLYDGVNRRGNRLIFDHPRDKNLLRFNDEFIGVNTKEIENIEAGEVVTISGFVNVHDTSEVFLVVEQHVNDKTIDYRGYPAKDGVIIDSVVYLYVPFIMTDRDVKAYIWNKGKREIRLSEFDFRKLR